jgi:hypothetical protein
VIGVDREDVVETRDRPVRAVLAVAAEVHGCFATQPREVGADQIGFEQFGVCDVQFVERNCVRIDGGIYRIAAPAAAAMRRADVLRGFLSIRLIRVAAVFHSAIPRCPVILGYVFVCRNST